MTEYAFLIKKCEFPDFALAEGDEAQLIAERLAGLGGPLQTSLESFDDGGWRVLSHDLLRSNGSLIVSFLICRQRD
jgi:hypothetical protein